MRVPRRGGPRGGGGGEPPLAQEAPRRSASVRQARGGEEEDNAKGVGRRVRGLVQGKQMGCLGGWRVPPHGAGAGCPPNEVWLWGRRRSVRWRCAVLVWGLMAVSVAVVLLVRNFPTTLNTSLDPSKGALGLLRKIDGGKVGWISKPMCDLITPVMAEAARMRLRDQASRRAWGSGPEAEGAGSRPDEVYGPGEAYPEMGAAAALVHIPKTGGSALESAAAKAGILWGARYDERRFRLHSDPGKIAAVPDFDGEAPFYSRAENFKACSWCWGRRCCSWQHIPPAWIQSDGVHPEYLNAERQLCIVRNPFSRAVSQHAYMAGLENDRHGDGVCHNVRPKNLNRYIWRAVKRVKKGAVYHEDCHWVPQWEYVKTCTDIVHYERLEEELPLALQRLEDEGHLPAGAAAEVANEMFASHERGRRCEPVGPDDLGPYATRAIQTWFKEDFENLGYSTDVSDWREPPMRRVGP